MKTFLTSLSTLALAVTALDLTAQDTDATPDNKDEATIRSEGSYGIGTQFAGQFNPGELDVDAFVQGFRDKLEDRELKYSEQEIQEALKAMNTLVRGEREAQRKIDAEKNLEASKSFLEENAKREGVTTTESGLQYEVLSPGSGEKPRPADRVQVHYHGTLRDGTVFDSSVERGKPSEFAVGGVIKGWQEALTLMPKGAKWKLFIHPDLAYGERGSGRNIGPNEVLIFEVELLEIKPVQAVTPPVAVPPRPGNRKIEAVTPPVRVPPLPEKE